MLFINTTKTLKIMFLLYPLAPLFDYYLNIPIIQVLTVFLIILGINNRSILNFIKKNSSQVVILSAFLVLTLFSTLIYNYSEKNIALFLRITTYFILVMAVGGRKYNSEELQNFLLFYFFSLSTINIISIFDYFNVINIPFFNESTRLVGDESTSRISDLSGIYNNRNQYAIYLGIAFPISFYLLENKTKYKYLYFILFAINILAILLSFSRGIVLAIIILMIYKYKIKSLKYFTIILITLILFGLAFNVNTNYFRQYTNTMVHRFETLSVNEQERTRGDNWRYYSFLETLEELPEHPIGFGWGNIKSKYLLIEKNPHNTFVSIFRSAGLIGLFLLSIVLLKEKKWFKYYKNYPGLSVYLKILLVLFIFSFTHEITGTLIMWCIVGIILSTKNNYTINEPS